MLAGIMAFEVGPARRGVGAAGFGTDEFTSMAKVGLLMLTGVIRGVPKNLVVFNSRIPDHDFQTSWKTAERCISIRNRMFRVLDQFLPIS